MCHIFISKQSYWHTKGCNSNTVSVQGLVVMTTTCIYRTTLDKTCFCLMDIHILTQWALFVIIPRVVCKSDTFLAVALIHVCSPHVPYVDTWFILATSKRQTSGWLVDSEQLLYFIPLQFTIDREYTIYEFTHSMWWRKTEKSGLATRDSWTFNVF